MTSEEFLFILFYILLVFCVITPPSELFSAGFTVQNVFSDYIGSEQLDFVGYHMRRTSITLIVHSLLPLGFVLGFTLVNSNNYEESIIQFETLGFMWSLCMVCCLSFSFICVLIVFHWMNSNWAAHPIAVELSKLTMSTEGWRSIMSSINLEFRRFDKFTTGTHSRRLIVTDTWLMMTSTYTIYVARQADTHLSIQSSESHNLHYERVVGVQVLNIMVTSADQRIKPFKIRLQATEYSDLRNKIQSPIINARDIVIQQSLSDQFLEAFRHQVRLNPPYHLSSNHELENCIGCMQVLSNVKLQKCCLDGHEGEQAPRRGDDDNPLWRQNCQNCMCRPMWCLECMGKWFASRQNQHQPETWMASKSPCPTCRAVFCMLDICPII